jgi:molybdenum cofactor biosynthesis enzyme MoaA
MEHITLRPNSDVPPSSRYALESWKIDPSVLSEGAKDLWQKENEIPVHISEDNSLRPKILDACGMTCVFCHNEGTPVVTEELQKKKLKPSLGRVSIYAGTNGVNFLPGRMRPNEDLLNAMSQLKMRVDVGEIHLTGGEPTLHPELPEIIELVKEAGLSVKMTSNGENPKAFERCAAAGLDKVIFSVFGANAGALSEVQHPKFKNRSFAQKKIDSLHCSIDQAAEHGIEAVANVVVPGPGHEDRVYNILNRFEHLSVRLLNSLNDGSESYVAIYELLSKLGAVPEDVKLTAGSSNARVRYHLPNGNQVSFKQIRPARFNEICMGCEIDQQGKCEEGFYGLRLYINDKGEYLVGLCIQRMDLVTHLDEFLASEMPERLKAFRQAEKAAMEVQFDQQSVI